MCGTDRAQLPALANWRLEAFLGDLDTTPLPTPQRRLPSTQRALGDVRICLDVAPSVNNHPCPFGWRALPVASPLHHLELTGAGISHLLAIAYAPSLSEASA